MGLETATYIHELVNTNPVGATDTKAQGDDHIRLLKTTLSNTFPNVEGAVTASHAELNILDGLTASTTELNFIDGVTSAVQTQLDNLNTNKLATNGNGSNVTNLNASNIATGTIAAARLPYTFDHAQSTPTGATGLNSSGITVLPHQYSRVGNIVTISGGANLTVTNGSNILTSFVINPPIASDFTATTNANGGGGSNSSGGSSAAWVNASPSTNQLEITFRSTTVGVHSIFYTAQYIVQ
jgi:hypothetical protein